MNTILVPTDFSAEAWQATQYALTLAKTSNATVYLFHAYAVFQSGFQSESDNKRDALRSKEEAETAMAAVISELNGWIDGVDIHPICRQGHVIESIRKFVSETPIDLIVMGTDGAYGLKYQFLGTHTYEVAEHLPIPLLVVPDQAPPLRVTSIAFFTDYREGDRQTLTSLYTTFGSEAITYTLVHIHESAKPPKDEDFKRLAAYAAELRQLAPIETIDWELVHDDEDINAVKNIVSEVGADLLALTMVERTFLDKLLNKSLSKTIVLQSKTPVFIGR